MTAKDRAELHILREFLSMDSTPAQVQKKYLRISLLLKVLSIVAIVIGPLIIALLAANAMLALFVGLLSGMLLGIGLYYGFAGQQIPIWATYARFDREAIEQRINEISES